MTNEMLYIDPSTGELLDGPRPGAVEMPDDGLTEGRPDSEWLGDWYTKQICHLQAETAAVKSRYERIQRQAEARERYLQWRYGERLRALVKEGRGSAKFVDFDFARCGFRKSKRRELSDEDAALAWAIEHCDEAVKRPEQPLPYVLKSKLPETCPQLQVIEEENFYIKPHRVRKGA